jgi:hypothetical protein
VKAKSSAVSDSDAVFVGWQELYSGDICALYTIIAAGHPSCGSTVTEKTLIKLSLKIPKRHRLKGRGKSSQILSNEKRTDLNEMRSPICTSLGVHKQPID